VTSASTDLESLTDPEFHATDNVYRLWRWMRTNAPVHRHPPYGLPAFWSVTRYADVRAVLADPETFSSARGVLLRPTGYGPDPGGGLTLALTDPPRHRKLRSLIADRFSVRHVRAIADLLRADVRRVLRAALDRGTCDFAQDVANRLTSFLILRLMGVPEADVERLHTWTYEAFHSGRPLTAHLPLMRYFIELMQDRMGREIEDVVGMLVNGLVDDELLTETEILLNIENLVGATENAGLSIGAGVQVFLDHPGQWRRLRDDPGLLPTAIEEILRWTSSATHSMRTATRDCDIAGHSVTAGDRVVVWLPSANRDGSVFGDPDRFDVARHPNRHLALGFGEHVCVGGTIARFQMSILFTELLATMQELEPAGAVEPLRSLAVRGPAHLPVRLVAR
jgi:cytochrome P450